MSVEMAPISKEGLDFIRWKVEREKNPNSKHGIIYDGEKGVAIFTDALVAEATISELTKLRKRVEVLSEALAFYAKEMNYTVDDYHGVSGEMRNRCVLYGDSEERNDVYSYAGRRAREALKESAKIAESKELDNPESFERERGSSGV